MKSKLLITAFFAALSINAMANPPVELTNGTPGYTQGFIASGNCAIDWDNRNGYEPIIRDCAPHQFFVSVADDYVIGQGYFEIGTYYGGTLGVNDNTRWWYEGPLSTPWNAWGVINDDGTGTLWFSNGGYAVRAPYNDWAWALFAENGVGGQTWFGDSFTWNTTVMARVATVASDVAEPEVLALFALGLLLIGGRKWAGKGIWNFVAHLRNGKKLSQLSTGPSTI